MTVLTVQRAWRIMDACGANTGGGVGRGGVVIAERREKRERGGLMSAVDMALRDVAVSATRLDLPFIRG